ncbi:MAG: T9SS type A sorting domain-containing protein [Bacteroidota bacterium]
MAQDTLTVSVLPGYTHDAYFSFENGVVAQVPADNWDIAFEMQGFSASVRINTQKGVELRAFPNAGAADWATVDTAGMNAWEILYDSDTSWNLSSFTRIADPTDPFDLGWGTYDVVTHQVTGSQVYLLKLNDSTFKKVMINSLISGAYDFTFANLDGSDETMRQISKDDYGNKNFVYYHFAADSVMDREPMSSEWDLLFHQYYANLGGGTWYPVTGVMTNKGITTAEIDGIDPLAATLNDTIGGFDANISAIGNDWKSFNLGTFAWELDMDRSFFLKKNETDFYHLAFHDFGGSSDGNFIFLFRNMSPNTATEALYAKAGWQVFPNPASNQLNIRLDESFPADATLQLFDQQGRLVQKGHIPAFQATHQLALSALPSGLYWLSLEAEGQIWTQSVMKQ